MQEQADHIISDWQASLRQFARIQMGKFSIEWRLTLSLIILICFFISVFLLMLPAPDREQPQPVQRISLPIDDAPTATSVRKHGKKQASKPVNSKSHAPLRVLGATRHMVIIREYGEDITLKVGQRSPAGWKLVSASPVKATFISPKGEKVIWRMIK